MEQQNTSPRLYDVFANLNFLLMWFAMFFSTVGTYFLLLALSENAYNSTGSATQSSLIFAAQWLAPLFTFLIIGRIASNGNEKKKLIISEIGAAVSSVLIGVFFGKSFIFLLALLFIRGFLEALTKTLRDTALKRLSSDWLLEKSVSVFGTSYYLGIASGSIVSLFFHSKTSLVTIAFLDALTFIVSAIAYSLISSPKIETKTLQGYSMNLRAALQSIRQNQLLNKNFFLFVFSVGLFQGFHNIARSAISGQARIGSFTGLQLVQLLFISGVVLGAFFVSRYLQRASKLQFYPRIYLIITCILMVSSVCLSNPYMVCIFYLGFAFFFEVCFTKFKNELVINSPKNAIGQIMSLVQVASTTSLVSVILIFGNLVDRFGAIVSVLIVGSIGTVLILIFNDSLFSVKETV